MMPFPASACAALLSVPKGNYWLLGLPFALLLPLCVVHFGHIFSCLFMDFLCSFLPHYEKSKP